MRASLFLVILFTFTSFCSISAKSIGNESAPSSNLSTTNQQQAQWYIKRQVGACPTKEDLKLFTQFAVKNDTESISAMILLGRIVVVGPGPCKMIKLGILTSYIEYKGQKLYIDTEELTKDKSKVQKK